MNKLAETISLTALLTLILSGIIIAGAAIKISDLFSTSKTNIDQLPKIVGVIDSSELSSGGEVTSSQLMSRLFTDELFLFFSKGTGPIKLKYKGDKPDLNGHLIFERPTTCNNKACVCYCQDGPYWESTDSQPYLQKRKLITTKTIGDTGYTCVKGLKCENVLDPNTIFVNGRGTERFAESVKQSRKETNTEDIYLPINMDIPLLLNSPDSSDDGNLFFSNPDCGLGKTFKDADSTINDNYNKCRQDTKYVNFLTKDYEWEGGVVIGGFGYSEDLNEDEDLSSIPVRINIQRTTVNHLVGVCIYEECIYQDQTDFYSELFQSNEVSFLWQDFIDYMKGPYVECEQNSKSQGIYDEEKLKECTKKLANNLQKILQKSSTLGNNYQVELKQENLDNGGVIVEKTKFVLEKKEDTTWQPEEEYLFDVNLMNYIEKPDAADIHKLGTTKEYTVIPYGEGPRIVVGSDITHYVAWSYDGVQGESTPHFTFYPIINPDDGTYFIALCPYENCK